VPDDWSLTTVDLSTNGRAVLEASGSTPMPAGLSTIINLTANVPVNATYGESQVLQIGSLALNGGAIVGIADRAVQKVAYLGDASGNRGYSGLDAALIARNSVMIDHGFDAYPLVDPVIIADVTGDGSLSALDASEVASKAVGLPVADIPDLPASNFLTPVPAGIDLVVKVPPGILVGPGGTADAVVSIEGATGLKAFDLTMEYDTTLLDLTAGAVKLTGLTGSGWCMVANIQDDQGKAIVAIWTTQPLSGDSGNLLDLAFHIPAAAVSGTSALDLNGKLNEGQLEMTAVDGSVVVDANGPVVNQVLVASTSWPQEVRDAFGGIGFAVPAGGGQLASLPWTGLDQIIIVFNEDVHISPDALAVHGVNVANHPIAAFHYDSANRTATWTLSRPIETAEVLQLALSDGARDIVGNALDGEWSDGQSLYPSGNGVSGGNFQMQLHVLAGDLDGDGTVGVSDLMALEAAFGQPAAGGVSDLDGNGVVDAMDYLTLKANFGQALPVTPTIPVGGKVSAGAVAMEGLQADSTAAVAPPAEASPSVAPAPVQANVPSAGSATASPALPASAVLGASFPGLRVSDEVPIDVLASSRADAQAAAAPRPLLPCQGFLSGAGTTPEPVLPFPGLPAVPPPDIPRRTPPLPRAWGDAVEQARPVPVRLHFLAELDKPRQPLGLLTANAAITSPHPVSSRLAEGLAQSLFQPLADDLPSVLTVPRLDLVGEGAVRAPGRS
jgi:hypothetical protein